MKKVKIDLNQAAAVMLLKGTSKQQEEALVYCGIKKDVVEDTGYALLMENLINTPHQQVHGLTNSSCIKCGFLEKDMVSVGPICFCLRCFNDEFFNVINFGGIMIVLKESLEDKLQILTKKEFEKELSESQIKQIEEGEVVQTETGTFKQLNRIDE